MLNTFKIGGNTTSVSFNSPSTGIIQKSHPQSRFIKFHHTSPLAKCIFDSEPHFKQAKDYPYKKERCTVLQLMAFDDGEFICELVEDVKLKTESNELE